MLLDFQPPTVLEMNLPTSPEWASMYHEMCRQLRVIRETNEIMQEVKGELEQAAAVHEGQAAEMRGRIEVLELKVQELRPALYGQFVAAVGIIRHRAVRELNERDGRLRAELAERLRGSSFEGLTEPGRFEAVPLGWHPQLADLIEIMATADKWQSVSMEEFNLFSGDALFGMLGVVGELGVRLSDVVEPML